MLPEIQHFLVQPEATSTIALEELQVGLLTPYALLPPNMFPRNWPILSFLLVKYD